MQKTIPGCLFQQMCSSLMGISMKRDHMKDLRRYLVLKYIQYLVLSSSNAVSTFLGLLGSLYAIIILQSAKVSSKSTAVLISSLAKADVLVIVSIASEMVVRTLGVNILSPVFTSALLQNLLSANTHISCLLLSCVAFEAYLITFFATESRHFRTVKNARLTSRIIWILVTAECTLFQADDLLKASSTSALTHSPYTLLFPISSTAAALLRSLSYILGILLRIVNVYLYYKIFFSMSNRSTLKTK
ncbi:G-protein coupled receptor 183-B-like [Pezoporus wallicus]|uniref:G-protein coupled receptor 183-B-like n=1 Tax=Pezoporus wallicus TaxID=35540 RepID=UPI002551BB17|nr:G-protein coupled receptor 183-B-like [Pezoporus wallicus]